MLGLKHSGLFAVLTRAVASCSVYMRFRVNDAIAMVLVVIV